jgi:hypothetical protein
METGEKMGGMGATPTVLLCGQGEQTLFLWNMPD